MKSFFDKLDSFPNATGTIHFAPPTFYENLTGAIIVLLFILALVGLIVAIAYPIYRYLERRDARRPVRYGVRRA